MLERRSFLKGIIAAAVAPAIIRTPGLIMPIKPVPQAFVQMRPLGTKPLIWFYSTAPEEVGSISFPSIINNGDTITLNGITYEMRPFYDYASNA